MRLETVVPFVVSPGGYKYKLEIEVKDSFEA
jgi:hypothetical protein